MAGIGTIIARKIAYILLPLDAGLLLSCWIAYRRAASDPAQAPRRRTVILVAAFAAASMIYALIMLLTAWRV